MVDEPMPLIGLKFTRLNTLNTCHWNSNLVLPAIVTRLTTLMSTRITFGPVTSRLRTPQSPKPVSRLVAPDVIVVDDCAVSRQSGPLGGAKYRPLGAPAV